MKSNLCDSQPFLKGWKYCLRTIQLFFLPKITFFQYALVRILVKEIPKQKSCLRWTSTLRNLEKLVLTTLFWKCRNVSTSSKSYFLTQNYYNKHNKNVINGILNEPLVKCSMLDQFYYYWYWSSKIVKDFTIFTTLLLLSVE